MNHDETSSDSADTFKQTIIQLRTLKFARLLLRSLRKTVGLESGWIFASISDRLPTQKFAIAAADYVIVTNNLSDVDVLSVAVDDLISKRPLSKFGLEAHIRIVTPDASILTTLLGGPELYCYSLENSHRFRSQISPETLMMSGSPFPIVSPIGVAIDEQPDY